MIKIKQEKRELRDMVYKKHMKGYRVIEMKYEPYDYQRKITEYIIKNKKGIIMSEIRAGDRLALLASVYKLKFDYFKKLKVIVISSKYVTENVWMEEIVKCEPINTMKWSLIMGNAAKKKAAIHKKADIFFTSYDNIMWIINNGYWDFNMVIIDDLSAYKNEKSKRYIEIEKVISSAERIVGIADNLKIDNIDNIWATVFLFDKGIRLGKTRAGFYERYFFNIKLKNGRCKREAKRGAVEAIEKAVSDISFCVYNCKKSKALEYISDIQYVSMDVSEVSKYKWMETEMKAVLTSDYDAKNCSSSALAGNLLQMANGAVYDDKKNVHILHNKKIYALKNFIDMANGAHVMVAYWFKHDRQRLLELYPEARVIETLKDVKAWNDGKITIGLMHPALGDERLKLANGGHVLVWFSLTWSLKIYRRMINRFLGEEQTKRLIVYHLVTKNTIDEKVIEFLKGESENDKCKF